MSSVTTSTTEWLQVQPFSSTVGVWTRTLRRALRAVLGEPVVGEGGAEDVDRVAVGQVLRGGVQVVALEEREHGVLVRDARALVSAPVGRCPPTGLFSATRAARSSSSALASSSLVCIVLWLLSRAVA